MTLLEFPVNFLADALGQTTLNALLSETQFCYASGSRAQMRVGDNVLYSGRIWNVRSGSTDGCAGRQDPNVELYDPRTRRTKKTRASRVICIATVLRAAILAVCACGAFPETNATLEPFERIGIPRETLQRYEHDKITPLIAAEAMIYL